MPNTEHLDSDGIPLNSAVTLCVLMHFPHYFTLHYQFSILLTDVCNYNLFLANIDKISPTNFLSIRANESTRVGFKRIITRTPADSISRKTNNNIRRLLQENYCH